MRLYYARKIIPGFTALFTSAAIILNLMVYQVNNDFFIRKTETPKIYTQPANHLEAVNFQNQNITRIELKYIGYSVYGKIEEVHDNLFYTAVKQTSVRIHFMQKLSFQKFISAHFATST